MVAKDMDCAIKDERQIEIENATEQLPIPHFPFPDTVAMGYCCVYDFFYPFAFEEPPYWDADFKTADDLELAKRFLMQLRLTCGYDVDCYPPPPLESPFIPVHDLEQCSIDHPRDFEYDYMRPLNFAIKEINKKEGLNLEFVGFVKVVTTMFFLKFFTFNVRVQESGPIQTVQALVSDEFIYDTIRLMEWRGGDLNHKPLLQVCRSAPSD